MSADIWNNLAREDPMWAICTDPAKRDGGWNPDDFFRTGCLEIGRVMRRLEDLKVVPNPQGRALDFGCGVGRLTRAMSDHFAQVMGFDFSSVMVDQATQLNRNYPKLFFTNMEADQLKQWPTDSFDFVYSSLVLQHNPPVSVQHSLHQLTRMLKPDGVMVFQTADHFNQDLIHTIGGKTQIRTRYHQLRQRLGWEKVEPVINIPMYGFRQEDVERTICDSGGRIIDVRLTNSTDPAFNGNLLFLDKEPQNTWVSKQYSVVKR